MDKLGILFSLLFLCHNFVAAQQADTKKGLTAGIVEYDTRIVLEQTFESVSTLKFNRTKSIFKWRLDNGTNVTKENATATQVSLSLDDKIGHFNIYNPSQDTMFSRVILDQVYLLKEEIPEINWNLKNETKVVGKYTCQKATAQFRGRTYTVWYTPKISVPYGPWKLTGLPGLILEAYDTNREIYFSVTKLSFEEGVDISKMPLNGQEKKVSLSEFKDISKNVGERLAKKMMKGFSKMDVDVEISDISAPKLMEQFEDGR